MPTDVANEYRIGVDTLRHLFVKLLEEGYDQIGPVFRDGAIMLEKLTSFDDLALGYLETQQKGKYNLEQHPDKGYFQYAVGPQSFKKYLHPPRRKLWDAKGSKQSFQVSHSSNPPKMVFWGVRNCDLEAIRILDRVFLEGSFINDWYKAARDELLTISVGCTHPSNNCFCTTQGSGPMPLNDYDLRLIEFKNGIDHYFLAHSNSSLISSWLQDVGSYWATDKEREKGQMAVEAAAEKMPERFDRKDVAQKLKQNLQHPHWEDIASRCLSCANCTLVCPTCFCTTTEDITDITGEHTERWVTWDTCFVGDFSYIHGGQIRQSTKSKYRQWMTHKMSNWYEQFGSSGCVGCGRCITWCPVGIDITEEIQELLKEPSQKKIKHENVERNT